MNASHAPRRYGSVARCACSKQNSSISLGAAKAEVTLISAKKVIATGVRFKVMRPPWGGGTKISPAFSLGPMWQFSSHKSVFFSAFAASFSRPSGELAR